MAGFSSPPIDFCKHGSRGVRGMRCGCQWTRGKLPAPSLAGAGRAAGPHWQRYCVEDSSQVCWQPLSRQLLHLASVKSCSVAPNWSGGLGKEPGAPSTVDGGCGSRGKSCRVAAKRAAEKRAEMNSGVMATHGMA